MCGNGFRNLQGIRVYIDHSVYPDLENLPEELVTPEDKADYIQRICAAWDFLHSSGAGDF